ncbi:MAG: aspartyl/asparaginyl beta-hydroxylase domain-containing protein [Comamonadaceae bacterium]|jgi:aspartate beta-hydroxylase/beta-hydroxylase|nr:aspartyl/asparaginyl beta-hydroxylase domain-containing protein [Comamonadaceae bacterium]
MDYHAPKRAVNKLLLHYAGRDRRPVFFDIDAVCPPLRGLEQAFPQIQAECDALLAGRVNMPRYHDINRPATEISATTPGDWKVYMLELLGHKPAANRARCPATCAALARVPGVLQAFFSVLDPGKSIPEHDGPYLGYLRYHLGIRVPRQNPPYLRVAGQAYTWREGEAVLFDDSWPHAVFNQASEPRVVLIVDLPRPLPLLPRLVNDLVLWGLAAPLYGAKVMRKADQYNGDLF